MTHTFGTNDATRFHKRIVELLAPLEKEFGAKVSIGNTVYGNILRTKVELHKTDESGVDTTEESTFKAYSSMYGVSSDMFNKVITVGFKRYQLVGLSPRSHKFPFKAVDVDTKKTWKLSESMVKRAITG